MKHSIEDTIAAIATPPGIGGLSIIRISGSQALPSLYRIFKPKGNIDQIESHRFCHGEAIDPDKRSTVDEVMAVYMKAPKSFTGEDVVEISCHGGVVTANRLLRLALQGGARVAERGEFSKRAYLNGKMDLLQAEAIIELVNAKTGLSAEIAVEQMRGGLSREIKGLTKQLKMVIAGIEAEIDFPDEIEGGKIEGEIKAIEEIIKKIKELLASAEDGKVLREGVRVAIVGKPNVGKSSLMNLLVGEERVIVTDEEGTTRDAIEEVISIGGVPIIVVDTAGIRHPKGKAEEFGVERAIREMDRAELILIVIDASMPISDSETEIIRRASGKKALVVFNKSDLGNQGPDNTDGIKHKKLRTSALNGDGINELRAAIVGEITSGGGVESDRAYINERHRLKLAAARKALIEGRESCKINAPADIRAICYREAVAALEEVSGERVSDEVVNAIFDNFCVGK